MYEQQNPIFSGEFDFVCDSWDQPLLASRVNQFRQIISAHHDHSIQVRRDTRLSDQACRDAADDDPWLINMFQKSLKRRERLNETGNF
ncbi:MAG TPA: hypothetical protein VMN57_05890 [Anaerolineales bacterium]|nr:hypothetical protein [Anaerolineales bacterium]